jgi:acetyl-CoA carboxylase biotin carboxyl carrier protein
MRDGRRFVPEREARVRTRDDGTLELLAPQPGLHRGAPEPGTSIAPGASLGELEVLGVLHRLRAPNDAYGIVVSAAPALARRPVDYATVLVVLDKSGAVQARAAEQKEHARETSGPTFKMPIGGRYYARPSPDAEPFVRVGDEVVLGQTVALIEVMKTFNRVTYGGAGLPKKARVKSIEKRDGDDVEAGEVLLTLEETGE